MSKNRLLTRRRALHLGLGTLAGIGVGAKSKFIEQTSQVQEIDDSERDFIVVGEAPLKERAAAKGLIYGAAAKVLDELWDAEYAASITKECGMLVPKWVFRWNWLNPSPDNFNFKNSDWAAEWTKTHDMLLRGHVLIYENSMPKWFWSKVNRQNAEQVLLKYIETVAGRYAGQMHSWDVVNEVVAPSEGRSDGLKNTRWLQLLGPDYIDLAFRAAAEADPQALLVFNENGLYTTGTEGAKSKRVAILKLLEHLKSKGTPIHALGLQGHMWKGGRQLNPRKLRTFVREVGDLGLKIMVTELDVHDRNLPKDVEVRDRLVAQAYEDYLSAVLDEPAVIAVITWGLSDRHTWYGKVRKDGGKSRPLPLDAQMNRKLAWNAMARAFDNAPSR